MKRYLMCVYFLVTVYFTPGLSLAYSIAYSDVESSVETFTKLAIYENGTIINSQESSALDSTSVKTDLSYSPGEPGATKLHHYATNSSILSNESFAFSMHETLYGPNRWNSSIEMGASTQGSFKLSFLVSSDYGQVTGDVTLGIRSFFPSGQGSNEMNLDLTLYDNNGVSLYDNSIDIMAAQDFITINLNETYTVSASFNTALRVGTPDSFWSDEMENGVKLGFIDYERQPIPEPATLLLFGIGLSGIVSIRLKKITF